MSFRTHTMRKGSLRGAAFYDPPTPAAPPVFGETTTTVPTLEQQILDDPDSYPDGHVVFVNEIDYPDENGDTVTTTGGWIVVYDSVPVPTFFPSGSSYGGWLKNYPAAPDGVTTWVEDENDGDGGLVTTVDGEPIPTGPGSRDTTCSGGTGVKYAIGAAAINTAITMDLSVPTTTDLP